MNHKLFVNNWTHLDMRNVFFFVFYFEKVKVFSDEYSFEISGWTVWWNCWYSWFWLVLVVLQGCCLSLLKLLAPLWQKSLHKKEISFQSNFKVTAKNWKTDCLLLVSCKTAWWKIQKRTFYIKNLYNLGWYQG